jgi:hypothetical protein
MIKKLVTITALAMLFASSSTLITFYVTAAASEMPAVAEEVLREFRTATFLKKLEVCKGKSEFAGELMLSRQNGDQMSDKIDILLKNPNPMTSWMIGVTRLAWEEPFWQTTENRQKAVGDFKNQIYTECFDEATAEEK